LQNFAAILLVLETKSFFFGKKSHALRFSIVQVVCLVGCDFEIGTLEVMYVTQKK